MDLTEGTYAERLGEAENEITDLRRQLEEAKGKLQWIDHITGAGSCLEPVQMAAEVQNLVAGEEHGGIANLQAEVERLRGPQTERRSPTITILTTRYAELTTIERGRPGLLESRRELAAEADRGKAEVERLREAAGRVQRDLASVLELNGRERVLVEMVITQAEQNLCTALALVEPYTCEECDTSTQARCRRAPVEKEEKTDGS